MLTMLTFNSGSIQACGHNDITLEKVKLGLNKTQPCDFIKMKSN